MKTVGKLFFLFTVVTFLEVYLLLELTNLTSWWVTVATVFVPGILGAWLARREGSRAIRQIREAMLLGQEPARAILDGVIVLVASVLLITPGVLTDVTGLLLLIPPIRRRVAEVAGRRFRAYVDRKLQSGSIFVYGGGGAGPRYDDGPFEIIDAEDVPKPARTSTEPRNANLQPRSTNE
jgi:UPF0716 protein FxsA